MRIDLAFEDLFIVTHDESKVHFGYNNDRLVTLIFRSPDEAFEFHQTRNFLNPRSPYYCESLSGVVVKSVFIGRINDL